MKLLSILVAASALFASSLAFAANTQINITASNKTTTTVTPSAANYAGTVAPNPVALSAGQNQVYINSGIGNVTSFHIDYGNTSGKKCHFDAASYNQSTSTSPCVYTKAAKSIGSSFANCTATVTAASTNPANCAFSVKFEIR